MGERLAIHVARGIRNDDGYLLWVTTYDAWAERGWHVRRGGVASWCHQTRRQTMTETTIAARHGSYLMPSLAHATVADAMHPGIHSCTRDTPLTEIARLMATQHVHCVAVTDGGEGLVWGIVSDLDLLRAGIKPGAELTAGELTGQPLASVRSTMPLREAAGRMLDHGASHVVVIDPLTERPVGILSTLDIAGVLAWGEA
jgi:CBS domain-containing protein